MTNDSFEVLLEKYFHEELSAQEALKFNQMLQSSEKLRNEFWAHAHLQNRLAQELQSLPALEKPQHDEPVQKRKFSPGLLTALAAILMVGFLVLVFQFNSPSEERFTIHEEEESLELPKEASVAILTDSIKSEWKSSTGLFDGNLVFPGLHHLESGSVTLDFYTGARVKITGPAKFEIKTDSLFKLCSGDVMAEVPDVATGFAIETPSGRIVDLGTRFQLSVDEQGLSKVAVQEGEVEVWAQDSDAPLLLTEERGANFSEEGLLEEFVLEETSEDERYSQWKNYAGHLAKDPLCLLYLDFHQHDYSERSIVNHATHPNAPSRVTLVGAATTPGRWPGTSAKAFRRECDRALALIPGTYSQVTWLAWVRPENLSRTYSAIVLSDFEVTGQAHWQLSSDGAYQFGIMPTQKFREKNDYFKKFHRAFSDPFVDRSTSKWLFLATTYDATSQEVVHYLDGEFYLGKKIPEAIEIQFGRATIGNGPHIALPRSSSLPRDWHTRQFGGAIDELGIFGRTFTPEEIREIFLLGRGSMTE